ncbi:MAG TPA: hypothetical protein VM198_13495 [Longimicrobiales bacterium]|nr:hypothetical protein [Longimicrobiales bacterium]
MMEHRHANRARPIGRVLRLLAGVALVAEAGRHLIGASSTLIMATVGVALGALVFFYTMAHLVIARFFQQVNAWLGAVLAVAPVAAVFVLGGAPGRLGALLFIGISLLLTWARADGGCEVMTLPGMLLGKRTHLVCIAFSPIDWLEEKLAARRSAA